MLIIPQPSPTGLETMPAFSTSLGCMKAPYIYNSSRLAVYVPMGTQESDHGFDIHGNAVGTITIAAGEASSSSIKYEMTIRATERSLLDTISLSRPVELPDGTVENSRAVLGTPVFSDSASCVRYDITIYVPPTLKKLHVAAHTTTHIQFDPESHINIDSLFVTAYAMSTDNMILPHDNLHAKQLSLEVYRGWIVGEAAIVDNTRITSQRGDGIINVKTVPTALSTRSTQRPRICRPLPGRAYRHFLHFTKGSITPPYQQRAHVFPIIVLRRPRTQNSRPSDNDPNTLDLDLPGKARDDEKFTHYHGDSNGLDKLFIKTRGWAGVYF
ncbi:Cysteine proteinase [Salix suchowensis]|nr:Cysteine proteinase [Salix suchowensis]